MTERAVVEAARRAGQADEILISLRLPTLAMLMMAAWFATAVGAKVSSAQTIVNPRDVLGPATSPARAPAVDYRSPFDANAWSDAPAIESWTGANDEARKLGGHAGQLRDGAARPGHGHAGHSPPASVSK